MRNALGFILMTVCRIFFFVLYYNLNCMVREKQDFIAALGDIFFRRELVMQKTNFNKWLEEFVFAVEESTKTLMYIF